MTSILIKTEKCGHRHREGEHPVTEAEILVVLPQAKHHQEPPEAKVAKRNSLLEALEGAGTPGEVIIDFWTPSLLESQFLLF